MMEKANLYFRTSGVESDICNKELFEVRRYRDEFQDLVLRPEGTASCMREIIDNNLLIESKEGRFYYIGEMFRYNRAQRGRLRQHVQLGCEFIGSDSVYSDYEIIELACNFLNKLNLKYELEINSIGTKEDRDVYREQLKEYFEKNDIKCEKDPLKILDKLNEFDNVPKMNLSKESMDRFEQLQDVLTDNQINFTHNPYIIRGLDYYNDLVFEIKIEGMTILAGGRYNQLSEQINSKHKQSAVGFACGVERIMLFADIDLKNTNIAIVSMNVDKYSLKVARKMRSLNYKCCVYRGYKVTKALNFLSKEYKYVVIIGEDEEKKQTFNLKNLDLSEQKEFYLNDDFVLF